MSEFGSTQRMLLTAKCRKVKNFLKRFLFFHANVLVGDEAPFQTGEIGVIDFFILLKNKNGTDEAKNKVHIFCLGVSDSCDITYFSL